MSLGIINFPAQLWLGSSAGLVTTLLRELQSVFCQKKGCGSCVICRQIDERTHAQLIWLAPERQYKLEQLAPVMERIQYQLNTEEHVFFVFEQTAALGASVANSLLKIVEEPPAGYHFIFLAEQQTGVLPTIVSRCVVRSWNTGEKSPWEKHALYRCFTGEELQPPAVYLRFIDKIDCNERHTAELLDALLGYWGEKVKKESENQQAQGIVTTLQQYLVWLPMSGGSKLFWKNLYVQLYAILAQL